MQMTNINYDRLAIAKEIHNINISDVHIKEGLNQRVDYGDIQWLAESIFENGVLEPIRFYLEACEDGEILKKGKRYRIYVTEGHRRLTAIYWGQENIPGFKEKITVIQGINSGSLSNEEDWLAQQILLNDKKALTPLEKGKVFKRLKELGMTEHQISKKFNTGFATVQKLLILTSAPTEVLNMVEEGRLTSNAVIETLEDIQDTVGRSSAEITKIYHDSLEVQREQGSKGKASPKHVQAALEKKAKRKPEDIPLHEKSDKALLGMLWDLSVSKTLSNGFTELTTPTPLWEEVARRLHS